MASKVVIPKRKNIGKESSNINENEQVCKSQLLARKPKPKQTNLSKTVGKIVDSPQIVTRSKKGVMNGESKLDKGLANSDELGDQNFAQRVWNKFNALQKAKTKRCEKEKVEHTKKPVDHDLLLQPGEDDDIGLLDYEDNVSIAFEGDEDGFKDSDEEDEDEAVGGMDGRIGQQEQPANPSTLNNGQRGSNHTQGLEVDEFYNMGGDLDSEIQFRRQESNVFPVTGQPALPSSSGLSIQEMVTQIVQKEVKQSLSKMLGQSKVGRSVGNKGNADLVERQVNDQMLNECVISSDLENANVNRYTGNNSIASPKTRGNLLVKSPSDTTIYAPLLKKSGQAGDDIIEQISNFVDSVRVSHEAKANQRRSDVTTSGATPVSRPRHAEGDRRFVKTLTDEQQQMKIANQVADKTIIDAEKYKVNTDAPQGLNALISQVDLRRLLDNDDNFFYVTCHVDPNIKDKIERGEFVDLEKLMPRSKPGGFQQNNEGGCRMEWVTRGGMMYLAPVQEKENKINGIRKWKQAFRIYAAIYTKANPHRASEIWQYVYTINTAAASYHWDNIAFYDYTFRQLMAEKPWRNWSKTYTQGWNLALKDPINKNPSYSGGAATNHNQTSANKKRGEKDWRDDCCWWYNKNNCNKSSEACHFDHRCTYCGGWYHSFLNCRKRLRNETTSGGQKHNDRRSSGNSNGSKGNNGKHSSTDFKRDDQHNQNQKK